MVIFGDWQGQKLTLSVKPNCLTLSLQDARATRVFSFDLHGRLWTAMRDGISYRRGLDGKIIAKWSTASYAHDRRWLNAPEARALDESARQIAAAIAEGITGGSVRLDQPLPPGGQSALRAAARFDRAALEADLLGYRQVYAPVGILPPDQYMAVVLQATLGCSFNTCTFCTFYRDRPFRIRTPQEFEAHALAVRAYLGAGLSLRRTIFLGDANALVIPMPRLLPLFDVLHRQFDVEALGGVYAFLDGFSGEKKTAADFAALRDLGLKRVYIGMESGNADLLRFLRKPGSPPDAVSAVTAMKQAGVAVGIIVLLGAGGHEYAAAHVRDTLDTLNRMPLDLDDLIYFSELVESEGLEYTRTAYQQSLTPLTAVERAQQGEQIEDALRFSASGGTPHISRYDIREFVY